MLFLERPRKGQELGRAVWLQAIGNRSSQGTAKSQQLWRGGDSATLSRCGMTCRIRDKKGKDGRQSQIPATAPFPRRPSFLFGLIRRRASFRRERSERAEPPPRQSTQCERAEPPSRQRTQRERATRPLTPPCLLAGSSLTHFRHSVAKGLLSSKNRAGRAYW